MRAQSTELEHSMAFVPSLRVRILFIIYEVLPREQYTLFAFSGGGNAVSKLANGWIHFLKWDRIGHSNSNENRIFKIKVRALANSTFGTEFYVYWSHKLSQWDHYSWKLPIFFSNTSQRLQDPKLAQAKPMVCKYPKRDTCSFVLRIRGF